MKNGSSAQRQDTSYKEVSFARDLGLFDASMIGIGAMIGAGIFVLTGIAAGEAGPASILAFLLNGAVTLLTAFSYAELASAIPRAGGGYSFVKKAFPAALGFVSGWMLWFAYTVACSLYALGFSGYFLEFVHTYVPSLAGFFEGDLGITLFRSVITVGIGSAFVLLNYRGAGVTGKAENVITMSKVVVLLIFVSFGLKIVLGNTGDALDQFTPFFPRGFGGVIIAMGLTFIAFEGYDLIATVAEEIKDPEKNIPRATFISVSVTLVLYMLIIFVSLGAVRAGEYESWEFLGKFKETAIAKAAENFMPSFGVVVVVIGGLLSTMSALNATVLASSRVAFSMGRDKWLPDRMATIHPRRRTPHIAILVTGLIFLIMAVTMPVQAAGSAASLMFLLTFTLVNISAIVLRKKFPDLKRRFKIPLYPVTPLLAIGLNMFLAVYQFNFEPLSWYVSLGWVAAGLAVYFLYVEKRIEKETAETISLSPDEERVIRRPFRVLVPVSNPDTVTQLTDLARPLAIANDGELIILNIVQVPRQLPLDEGLRFTGQARSLIRKATDHLGESGLDAIPVLRVAHHAAEGIISVAKDVKATFTIMGWKGYTNTRDRLFGEITDRVIRHSPSHLAVAKFLGDARPGSILIPTAGGPNAALAAEFVASIAGESVSRISACCVVPPEPSFNQRLAARELIEQTLEGVPGADTWERCIIEAKSVVAGLIKASADHDLLVMGAAEQGFLRNVLFGELPEKVARHSRCSTVIVKRHEGLLTNLVKRFIGDEEE
jgi:amino acid transporter/nucleotide-binding universal stress UspA family protein